MPRVVLHVGLPKCGSSYLQEALSLLGDDSAGGTVAVVGPRAFRAALDVTGTYAQWGRREQDIVGQWAAVCAAARSRSGTTVISSELLAYASIDQARHALDHLRGIDLDVVVVARDLTTLLPSRWQQDLKTGTRQEFAAFLDEALGDGPRSASARRNLTPLPAARAWGGGLAPDRVHLITVPAPGSDQDALWHRFAQAAGLSESVQLPEGRVNESLGVVGAELVRRVNGHVDRAADPRRYGAMVKRLLAEQLLAPDRSPRPALPARLVGRAAEVAEAWQRDLREAGYDVVGSLDELTPKHRPGGDPASVTSAELAELTVDVLARLLVRHQEQTVELRRLRRLPVRRARRRLSFFRRRVRPGRS